MDCTYYLDRLSSHHYLTPSIRTKESKNPFTELDYEQHDGCLIRKRNLLSFTPVFNPGFVVGFALLILFLCCFLFCLSLLCGLNLVGGAMVSMRASSAVDSGFDPRSDQPNTRNCFSTKHAALRRKSKDYLDQNPDNVSEWSDISTCGVLFQ